jgi:transposase
VPMLAELVDVVIGVDTHKHTHTAAVLAATTGAVHTVLTVTADPAGYAQLVDLAEQHPGLRAWAIEGANGYGAGLTRHLLTSKTTREGSDVESDVESSGGGEWVIEIDRPERPRRRAGAKSDEIDAVRAARDALTRTQLGAPRSGAQRAALQMLLSTRRGAVQAGADAQLQLNALVITAPEAVRARFRGQSTAVMITTAVRLRPHAWAGDLEVFTAMTALRELARRIRALQAEAAGHERALRAIVRSWRPDLLAQQGVGPIVAAVVLAAWSHPGRCRSEAAFAKLAGAAPIPASSGQTVRHRLNRSGDRQLNRALHTIALSRLRYHQPTRDYAERRRNQRKTDPEIRRCLKRYIARQLWRQLENPPATSLDEP